MEGSYSIQLPPQCRGPNDDLVFYTGFFVLKVVDIVEFQFCHNSKLSISKESNLHSENSQKGHLSLEFVICINALFDKLILFRNGFVMQSSKVKVRYRKSIFDLLMLIKQKQYVLCFYPYCINTNSIMHSVNKHK